MISNYHYWVLGPSKVVLPFLQHLDDCEDFSIIDAIVSFSGGEGGAMIGARVKVSVGVFLH